MIELTFVVAVGVIFAFVGLCFLVNGLLGGFLDEVIIAAVCFLIAWWLIL